MRDLQGLRQWAYHTNDIDLTADTLKNNYKICELDDDLNFKMLCKKITIPMDIAYNSNLISKIYVYFRKSMFRTNMKLLMKIFLFKGN